MTRQEQESGSAFDLVVVGGGVAGTVAAIAAARLGVRTALLHNRPLLGGASASDSCGHDNGFGCNGASEYHNANAREAGILEELRAVTAYRNAWGWSNHWSLVLREWAEREPNLTLHLNTEAHAVAMDGLRISAVLARVVDSDRNLRVTAPLFIDSSGDSVIAHAAGAEFRHGRESRREFGESLAPEEADAKTMGSSILFRAVDAGRPAPFKAPPWAISYRSCADLPYRMHGNPRAGYWWIECGGEMDTIGDNEAIYRKLLAVLYGVWDHLKNSGAHPEADNYVIDWVSSYPGKRESRRLVGDYLLTQDDVMEDRPFEDAVAYGGWPLDLHPPEGVFGKGHPGSTPPFLFPGTYGIPFRCLYSINIENLMMAGRNISVTHVALGSTRLTATCALCGQAVGTAASVALRRQASPREVGRLHIGELKDILRREDAALPGETLPEAFNLASGAHVTASSTMPLAVRDLSGSLPLAPGSKRNQDPADPGFDPCDAPPADRRRAQMFPVSTARIEAVVVWMNSRRTELVRLSLGLRRAESMDDFSSQTDLAVAEATVPPGERQPVTFVFGASVTPGGLYWICLPEVEGVDVCVSDRYLPGLYLKKDGCYPGNGAFCFEVLPRQEVFAPGNAVNGIARAGRWPNLWVSDPARGFPQSLELAFPAPTAFNAVELIFDTNLHKKRRIGAAVECVKDYRLEYAVAGRWHPLLAERDNIFRRRRHLVPPTTAERLRLTVEGTHGDPSARVYEMRVEATWGARSFRSSGRTPMLR